MLTPKRHGSLGRDAGLLLRSSVTVAARRIGATPVLRKSPAQLTRSTPKPGCATDQGVSKGCAKVDGGANDGCLCLSTFTTDTSSP